MNELEKALRDKEALQDRVRELEVALDDTTTVLEMVAKNVDFSTIYDEILVARKISSSRSLLEKKDGRQ